MPVDRNARYRLALYAGLLLLTGIPYLLAATLAGPEHIFGGFLFNPIDGNSYLAKMRQGWLGNWRFALPFSAQPGNGAYIYLFYLALGHAARIFSVPLLMVFHLARLVGAVFMLWSLARFVERVFPDQEKSRAVFFLAAFGSGLGWLALLGGFFTSDLWVSEAYPFLSAYNNPHFPVSLGLLVFLITPSNEPEVSHHNLAMIMNWRLGGQFGLVALALAELSPFGSVVAMLVSGILAIWEQWEQGSFKVLSSWLVRSLWIGAGAAPVLIYTWWVVQVDPALAAWNAQNFTPSPPWWDLTIAFSPALPLAILGAVLAVRKSQRKLRPAFVWLLLALLMVYIPLGLQRRFLIGIYIPITILGVFGLLQLTNGRVSSKLMLFGLIMFSLPSNLVVILAGWQGISSKDDRIYLSSNEGAALEWLATNTPEGALVLAGAESGLLIPAWSGRRVIYGHPFETTDAESERLLVENFFAGKLGMQDAWQLLERRDIDYLYWGPREGRKSSLNELLSIGLLELAYENPVISIYRVIENKPPINMKSAGEP